MGLRQITVDRINDPVDIYASDDSRIYESILGAEGVHDIGNRMMCEAIGNNQFRILDGVCSVQGRMAIIDPEDPETVITDIGQSGYKRHDLIVLDFTREEENDKVSIQVIKGIQSQSSASDPGYVVQDLTKGGTHRQVPLWRIVWDGTAIKSIDRVQPILPNMSTLVPKTSTSIDLPAGVDLSAYMQTAIDLQIYRKVAGNSISGGLNGTDSTHFYLKMRTFVFAYRNSDNTLWYANYVNKTLSKFVTYVDAKSVTQDLDKIDAGYVADARAIKVVNDRLIKCANDVENSVKYTGKKSITIDARQNPLTYMRNSSTLSYQIYTKVVQSVSAGDLPGSDNTTCYFIKFQTFIFGYSGNGHCYYSPNLDTSSLPDWAELPDANGVLSRLSINKESSNQVALMSFSRNKNEFFRFIADKDNNLLFAMYNANGLVSTPIKLLRGGAVEFEASVTTGGSVVGQAIESRTSLKGKTLDIDGTANIASLKASSTIGTSGQIEVDKTGSLKTTMIDLKRDGVSTARILTDGTDLYIAMYNANGLVSTPIKLLRGGAVEFEASLKTTSKITADQAEVTGEMLAGTVSTGKTKLGKESLKLVSATAPFINFYKGSDDKTETAQISQTSSNLLEFYIRNSNGDKSSIELYKSNDSSSPITVLRPSINGGAYLGNNSRAWNTVYATNTQIQSDRKLKRDIVDIQKPADFIMGLRPQQYKMVYSDTVEGRLHYGFIAQDVAQLADDLGLGDLSLYQASVITTEDKETIEKYYDPNDTAIKDKQLAWSLNYNEIVAPLVATVQQQQEEISSLKERIEKLESLL